MKQLWVILVGLAILNSCSSSTNTGKKQTDSLTNVSESKGHLNDSLDKQKKSDSALARHEFVIRLRQAIHKLNALDSTWRIKHPHYEDTFIGLPLPAECTYFSEADVEKLDPFEFLLFCAIKKESYTQMCLMYFPPGYKKTQTGIYIDYWDGISAQISTTRIDMLKKKSDIYLNIMDSILNYSLPNDSQVLMSCSSLYAQLDHKRFINQASQSLENGGDNFLATAILSTIEKKDIVFFKRSTMGKYFFTNDGEYRYPNGESLELIHVPFNISTKKEVLRIANKYLKTH